MQSPYTSNKSAPLPATFGTLALSAMCLCAVATVSAQVADFEDDRFAAATGSLDRVKSDGSIAVIQRDYQFLTEFADTGSGWTEGPFQQVPGVDETFAFDSDVLAAGAFAASSQRGAVFVYQRDAAGWLFEQQVMASDAQVGRLFGTAVDVEGDLLVVGNHFHDHGIGAQRAGAVYVFRYDGSQWVEEQRLIPDDIGGFDHFGWSVKIENGIIVAGAWGQSSGGAAYVYEYNGSSWVLTQTLRGTSAVQFGLAIDAFDDVLAISANGITQTGRGPGAVYVFRRTAGQWVEEQRLMPVDSTNDDRFGASLAMGAGWIACGAPDRRDTTGFIDVYRDNGAAWVASQRLEVSDLNRIRELGRRESIARSADLLIATADGVANVFDLSVNTGFGNDIVVNDQVGGLDLEITFSSIEAAGETTVTEDQSGGAPDGFRLTNPRLVFDIETTATFSGPIEVCLDYSGVQIQGNENRLKILHSADGSNWTDVTTFHDTVNDIICGEVASFSLVGVFEIADADNDGLSDEDEAILGTDPDDPDTDDDGLLDGAEVDIAVNGCPDPLNPDSDGDTLLDGVEVAIGTNPCNPDSDGDTVPDQIDPDPLTPDDAMSELEEATRLRADLIISLPLHLFNGPNANANISRRNALASHLHQAANFIAAGNTDPALSQLLTAFGRVDSNDPPPDWMFASEEQAELAHDIDLLITLLILQ